MRIRAVIGISFFVAGGCASRDESLGCAELVVTCPEGAGEQQWWLASVREPGGGDVKTPTSWTSLQIQGRECGEWLAYIENGATARYDNVNLGAHEGEMRLRVVVSADDKNTRGGTLTLYDTDADPDLTTPVATCDVPRTGGWFNWLVVDCGPLSLGGVHSLTFKFTGIAPYLGPYVFNFAAFGVVRTGAPDCKVTGPRY